MKADTRIAWALGGLLLGILLGAATYEYGLAYACPTRTCVDAAEITPVTDRGYFDAAHKLINGAKSSVHITAFELKYYGSQPNSSESQLMRDLIYAKERGVDVKIVVDEFSQENNAYDFLRTNGIEVIKDDNQTTTHAKLIIVDGKTVLIGSTNLSYFALERNNEANIQITDRKTAQYFEKYFQNIWDKNYI